MNFLILISFITMNTCWGTEYDAQCIDQCYLYSHMQNRPRLYLSKSDIEKIEGSINTAPYDMFWRKVKLKAGKYIREIPPVYVDGYNDGTIRDLGNVLPYMAIAYLITKNDLYLNGVKSWMNQLSLYPHWASDHDLGAAHILFGMAVSYDWLFPNFSESEKSVYRKKMIHHANILYNDLITGKIWWSKDYLQNHNYTNVMAIAVAGIALFNEEPKAQYWLSAAKVNFENVLGVLSPDGASHEGIGYWGYGTDALLKYFKAVEPLYGKQDVLASPFFKNTTKFRLYASLPGYNETVNFADSPNYDWYGPGYILRALASYFDDGHAQWLADRIEKARGDKAQISWLDLIWYDESVKPDVPDTLPLYAYFDNLGIFIARSDWSDNAMWVFFKAGPSQGRLAEGKDIFVGSHVHPDEGNFMIWSDGRWIIDDDGYSDRKDTSNHNVILINDIGQLGEGGMWFDGGKVRKNGGSATINNLVSTDNYICLFADMTRMYPSASELDSWKRCFVFLPRFRSVLIRDNVRLNQKCDVEALFHFSSSYLVESDSEYLHPSYTDALSGFTVSDFFHENSMRTYKQKLRMHGSASDIIRNVVSIYGKNTSSYENLILLSPQDGSIKNLSVNNNGQIFVSLRDGKQILIH